LGSLLVEVSPVEVPEMRVAPERRLSEEDARRLLTFVVEAMEGRRPVQQLGGLVDGGVLRELKVVGGRMRLGRLRVCRVGVDAAEVAGSLHRGDRVYALAARVEHLGGRWVCSVFKVLM
jgi:uncharacterized protein DUF6459